MKTFYKTYRFVSFFVSAFALLPASSEAQSLAINVMPLTCYVAGGPNGVSASVTSIPVGATSYSWWVGGPGTTTISPSTSNWSVATVYYGACGNFTIHCDALNSSTTLIASTTLTTYVGCSPTITVSGTTVCYGSSTTLNAFGAQSYSWSNGVANSVSIVVTPTISTSYTVTGYNSSGCFDTTAVTVNVVQNSAAGFTFTPGLNGIVNFVNTTSNPASLNTYTWNFGTGTSVITTTSSPTWMYPYNGTYTVTLTASTPCGITQVTHTVNVTTAGPSCAASFTYTEDQTNSGTVTFTSTSTGTTASTVYYWQFGNGQTYSGVGNAGINPPVQTYTSGNYMAQLKIVNPGSLCTDSIYQNVLVCLLSSNYSAVQTSSNTIHFTALYTGTIAASTYSWDYGDGSTGTGISTFHNYNAAGTYSIILSVANGPNCTSTLYDVVHVQCSFNVNFTHTVNPNGIVDFSSLNPGVPGGVYWDFGDGVYSIANSPSHAYSNAGTYVVTLKTLDSLNFFCNDSLTQYVNVTGVSCTANSAFSITPSGTPQYWNATPSYPWNITAATWYWGDGTQSNVLYTSHLYSVAATYSICLSVTVSCGASSTYCFPYPLNKADDASGQIISVNVTPPEKSNGLAVVNSDRLSFAVYPNPNNGAFSISPGNTDQDLTLSVYNLIGECIYTRELPATRENATLQVSLENNRKGIYFVRLSGGRQTATQKIVVSD